jgi:predicted GNAT superfamily acetyltransferase
MPPGFFTPAFKRVYILIVAHLLRPLQSHDEYLRAEEIQREVWGFPDREIIPLNELVVAQKNGGHVFGAFDGGRMVAFCFGVPGFKNKKVYHYSRMLGVLPEVRDQGLGYRMKLFQRELCLKQGLDLVRWTFDPLQSRNGFFNVEKLGVVIREYGVNLYGDISGSRFNAGLETDRFVTDWLIRSRRVQERIRGRRPSPDLEEEMASRAPGIEARFDASGLAVPDAVRPSVKGRRVYAEIPADIDELRGREMELVRRWRFETRKFFTAVFARGYLVTGFASGSAGGRRRSAYLLERNPSIR